MHTEQTNTKCQLMFSLVCLILFCSPLAPSAADVMGRWLPTLSANPSPAVLISFPLKCQASSVLRYSTVYRLPLLSTLLIDAICAAITPIVIKQHFSLPVLGCQALLPCSGVFFLLHFPLNNRQWLRFSQIARERGIGIWKGLECKVKVKYQKIKKLIKIPPDPYIWLTSAFLCQRLWFHYSWCKNNDTFFKFTH